MKRFLNKVFGGVGDQPRTNAGGSSGCSARQAGGRPRRRSESSRPLRLNVEQIEERMLLSTCVAPPQGLVSSWSGDGALNGSLQGGATLAPGKVGQAFKFDGVNGYMSAADSASLRPANLTIEGWFNFGSTVKDPQVLVSKTLGTGGLDSYLLWYTGGQLTAEIGNSSGMGPELRYAFTPAPNTWYHIAYTFDDASNSQVLYVDGVSRASGSVSQSIEYDAHPRLIGADINGESTGYFYSGQIDEVSVYNRAITGADIQGIYNAGSAGKCGGAGTGTTTVAPAAPNPLQAVAVSSTQVNLSWPSVAGAQNYRVYARPVGGTWPTNPLTIVQATGATSNSYAVTGLTAGSSYQFAVGACNSVGCTWAYQTAATLKAPVPLTQATPDPSGTQVRLCWNIVVGAFGFDIYDQSNGSALHFVIRVQANVSCQTVPDLNPGTSFTFVVDAFNSAYVYINSAQQTVATPPARPASPGPLMWTRVSSNEIQLSWSNVAGEDGYILEFWNKQTSLWTQFGSTLTDVKTTGVGNLSPGTTYFLRVGAHNRFGTTYTDYVTVVL